MKLYHPHGYQRLPEEEGDSRKGGILAIVTIIIIFSLLALC